MKKILFILTLISFSLMVHNCVEPRNRVVYKEPVYVQQRTPVVVHTSSVHHVYHNASSQRVSTRSGMHVAAKKYSTSSIAVKRSPSSSISLSKSSSFRNSSRRR